MLPERFLIAGVEQACRGPPRLTRCKSHKKRRLACGSSAHKRRHENWVDAGQNTRLKTSTISRELSFLLISRMSRFITQDRLGALLAGVLSKTPFDRIQFAPLPELCERMGPRRIHQPPPGPPPPAFPLSNRLFYN